MSFAAAAAIAALASAPPFAQEAETIAGRPYVRLATRAATEKAMRSQLSEVEIEWGAWRWLGPFPLPEGSKGIARRFPPEAGLARGGRVEPLEWKELDGAPERGGPDGFAPIDLRTLATGERVVGYLARRLSAARPCRLTVNVGSDDGLRLWLDGELRIDAPVERGFEPEAHPLVLELARGEHEIVAKVAQDAGGWMFQLAPKIAFDRLSEAQLDWRLQLDFPEGEARHWRIAPIAVPEEAALEVGGLDVLPDGRPIVCTRRGDVFVVEGAYELPPARPRLALFASGLHEPLGLAVRPDPRAADGWCAMLAQRGELTRLVDRDGDLRADLFETACDAWEISGNYHEYAFGPRYDDAGYAWITLNLAHTGGETVMGAPVATRGCAARVRPDGALEIVADGLRSPDGVAWLPGLGAAYTDNQGDFVATNKLSLLVPGSFHGHQSTLPMRERRRGAFEIARWSKGDALPAVQPPAIWFPYGRMGQSASDLVVDTTGGRFGPFAGQVLVGDQTHGTVMRVCLERIRGGDGDFVQGACFPFLSGFKSGVHRLRFAPDGSLLVGLTDRGWASRGGWRDGLERVLFTGETPFEILAIRACAGGFELELTQDVDVRTAIAPASYRISSFTYAYHPDYGSPELELASHAVVSAACLSPRRVQLTLDRPRPGFVHELAAPGLRSLAGSPLLHDVAWYTLQRLPALP